MQFVLIPGERSTTLLNVIQIVLIHIVLKYRFSVESFTRLHLTKITLNSLK